MRSRLKASTGAFLLVLCACGPIEEDESESRDCEPWPGLVRDSGELADEYEPGVCPAWESTEAGWGQWHSTCGDGTAWTGWDDLENLTCTTTVDKELCEGSLKRVCSDFTCEWVGFVTVRGRCVYRVTLKQTAGW